MNKEIFKDTTLDRARFFEYVRYILTDMVYDDYTPNDLEIRFLNRIKQIIDKIIKKGKNNATQPND